MYKMVVVVTNRHEGANIEQIFASAFYVMHGVGRGTALNLHRLSRERIA